MIEEQNVRLKLTITDTPGFGDQINNDKWYVDLHHDFSMIPCLFLPLLLSLFLCLSVSLSVSFSVSLSLSRVSLYSWVPILEYVNDQFAQYLHEEVSIVRKRIIPDTRVHCCLYFIPPTGHWYTSLSLSLPLPPSLPPSLPLSLSSHYFVFSLFYSLRPIDIEFMKRLDEFVNIVPVIAKSDTLTVEERDAFKARVRREKEEEGILSVQCDVLL